MNIVEGMFHQRMNQPPARVFWIGSDAGDAAHVHDFIVDIDFHRIDDNHGCQFVLIKPAKYIGFFQNRTFGVFDFVLFPSGLEQII